MTVLQMDSSVLDNKGEPDRFRFKAFKKLHFLVGVLAAIEGRTGGRMFLIGSSTKTSTTSGFATCSTGKAS